MDMFTTGFLQCSLSRVASKLSTPHIFHVGALDSWPGTLARGECAMMIFNTQYGTESGEHWLAVYVDGRNAFYFDSFPLRPFPQLVLSKLAKICDSVENVNAEGFVLQNPTSPLCGLYCLAFLLCAGNGQTLNLCANNVVYNDVHILDVVLPYLCSPTYAL